jgi:DNA-directed RNA polymerase subunit omega
MARVTVEDCLKVVPNRFELAVLSSYRAKEISKGAPIKVEKDNDKDTVISLKEISRHNQGVENLRNIYMRSLQQNAQADDVLEEDTHNVSEDVGDKENKKGQEEIKKTSGKQDALAAENLEDEFVSVDDYSFEDETELDD